MLVGPGLTLKTVAKKRTATIVEHPIAYVFFQPGYDFLLECGRSVYSKLLTVAAYGLLLLHTVIVPTTTMLPSAASVSARGSIPRSQQPQTLLTRRLPRTVPSLHMAVQTCDTGRSFPIFRRFLQDRLKSSSARGEPSSEGRGDLVDL